MLLTDKAIPLHSILPQKSKEIILDDFSNTFLTANTSVLNGILTITGTGQMIEDISAVKGDVVEITCFARTLGGSVNNSRIEVSAVPSGFLGGEYVNNGGWDFYKMRQLVTITGTTGIQVKVRNISGTDAMEVKNVIIRILTAK